MSDHLPGVAMNCNYHDFDLQHIHHMQRLIQSIMSATTTSRDEILHEHAKSERPSTARQ